MALYDVDQPRFGPPIPLPVAPQLGDPVYGIPAPVAPVGPNPVFGVPAPVGLPGPNAPVYGPPAPVGLPGQGGQAGVVKRQRDAMQAALALAQGRHRASPALAQIMAAARAGAQAGRMGQPSAYGPRPEPGLRTTMPVPIGTVTPRDRLREAFARVRGY